MGTRKNRNTDLASAAGKSDCLQSEKPNQKAGNVPPPAATSVLSQAVMTLKLQPEENIQAASRMTITAGIHSKASRQSPR